MTGKKKDDQLPLTPAQATDRLRRIANNGPTLHYTIQVKERMVLRDLTTSDLLHLLKFGFVYEPAQETTRPAHFKYLMDLKTPNSGNRTVRAVIIPREDDRALKIVSIMWVDEE